MKVLGYGEDGLTLKYLTEHIREIASELQGEISEEDISKFLLFFRPSFGRKGGKNSCEFGEFDSILATLNLIYLIESKWNNCEKKLTKVQILRHKIFRWYCEKWISGNYKSLKELSEKCKEEFENKSENEFGIKKIIDNENNEIYKNLEYVLKELKDHFKNKCKDGPKDIINVLICFKSDNKGEIKLGKDINYEGICFKKINVSYKMEDKSNFFELKFKE